MKFSFCKIAVIVMAFFLGGCATTMHRESEVLSRLYNLKTGEVVQLTLESGERNKSRVIRSSKTESGESFTGELTTTGRERTSHGVNVGWYNGGGWSVGADLFRLFGSRRQGSGVLVGSEGTVIDLTYELSGGNAEGRGKDNNGLEYRLQCCESVAE